MLIPRPIAALAAAGTLAVVAVGGVVAVNTTSSDSAQLSASCDPSPSVTDTTEGSQVTVTCTVPRTTVTVTADPTTAPTEPPTFPTPSDPPASPTPSVSVAPTPSETPKPTPTTPTPTVTPAPVGKAVLGASLGLTLPAAQPLDAVRYYRAPTWKGSELEAAYNKGTRVFVVSTKDATPASMVAMDQAAPKDATFYETSYHEPDDNIKAGTLTVATYVSRLNALCKAVAGFPNVKCGTIHNGFIGAATWKADEKGIDWSLQKFWGMDRYAPGYESAATQFKEGADYAKALGLPLVIGETGADPSNPAAQKVFAAQARAWALDPANGAEAVLWWEQKGYQFANPDVEHAFLG